MKVTKQFTELKREFIQSLTMTRQGLVAAGQTLLKMVEIEPNTYEILTSENPSLRADWLETLERIGRTPEMAELLLADTYAASKALRLDDDKAIKRLVNNPVPVVEEMEDGNLRTVQKRYPELNRNEADQLLYGNKIQTPEQQTEYIRQKRNREAERVGTYWIHDGKVTFRERATFTPGQLEEIVERIKGDGIKVLQEDMQKRQIAS